MSEPRMLTIGDTEYLEYFDSDLRFTGWEHECIIVDRTENHYWVPRNRYEELMKSNTGTSGTAETKGDPGTSADEGMSGTAGATGTYSTCGASRNSLLN